MPATEGKCKLGHGKKYFKHSGPVTDCELGALSPATVDNQFIDDIYDIALDPENLDNFIERLGAKRLDVDKVRRTLRKVEVLSSVFEKHISRAETFLDRLDDNQHRTSIQKTLSQFDTTAALIIDPALHVVALNSTAQMAFSIDVGDAVDSLPFDDDENDQLVLALRRVFRQRSSEGKLIHLKSTDEAGRVVILHATWHKLPAAASDISDDKGYVLIASTELYWPAALDQTLHEVFGLSEAERDIVRSLVDGLALKTIARDRNRSLGTVRTQLKSILAKTRAQSQSELIRVTLSLMEVIERSPELGSRTDSTTSATDFYSDLPSADQTLSFKPYSTLLLADGRKLDYLVQGATDGNPILFSHMGYGLARWHPAALAMAEAYNLKVVTPVRSGFGKSDPIQKNEDILAVTRNDTLAVMDLLGIDRCPYVVQGNDMLFAMDFAAERGNRVSEIIGLGGRLPLPSEIQYAGMGKWHHFFLSNARYAPHLLYFTTKAAFALARKVGRKKMFENMHKGSAADLSLVTNKALAATLLEASKLAVDDDTHAAFAYARELLETESDWADRVEAARSTPTWFVSGLQDPLGDAATIAAYRERFPWINIEVVEDAGQLLFFQQYKNLIPRFAEAAQRV
jgi:pimeloyl-ACP methyl ester carboxylesterase/DNA-binding CsgD family transcriptional regulator